MNIARYKKFIAASLSGLLLLCSLQAGAQAPPEEKLAAAGKVFKEAQDLFNLRTAEGVKAALPKFETALGLFRAAESKLHEAHCLGWIAYIYVDMGESRLALDRYDQALRLFRQIGDKDGEAKMLADMGAVHTHLGRQQQAIDAYIQAAPLFKQIGDKSGEATMLSNLGAAYMTLGENQKALECFSKALPIWKLVPDKGAEAHTLFSIGAVYSVRGEKQKGLEFFDQALTLVRQLNDKAAEAEALKQIGSIHDDLGEKQKAIEYYSQALLLFKKGGDTKGEAMTLYFIGGTYFARGENQKALEHFNRALAIFQANSDKNMESSSLLIIGSTYFRLGEKQKAIQSLNRALTLFKQLDNKEFIGSTSEMLGTIYAELGENQKAITSFEQSLVLLKQSGAKRGEATALNQLVLLTHAIGENKKALEYGERALLLFRQVPDKTGEAATLLNLGDVHHSLGENEKALSLYNLALPLVAQGVDASAEAAILRHIGEVYSDLEENQKALEFYDRSLQLERKMGDDSGEADTLNNMAGVYLALGQIQKAIESWNKSLLIWRKIPDKRGEATTLSNLGAAYFRMGAWQKALDFHTQSLPLSRAVGDIEGEATIVDNIGQANFALGRNKNALEFFYQALRLRKQIGDKVGEAVSLSNMMTASMPVAPLAIFYGKQSVNCLQQLRRNIDGLDKQAQQTYLKSVEGTYGFLAEVLILENRLPEAHQVLNLFKDEQFFDLEKTQARQPLPIAFTQRETTISERVSTAEKKLDDLKVKLGGREPNPEEKLQIQLVEREMKSATDGFTHEPALAAVEFSKFINEKNKISETRDLTEMQNALRQLSQSTGQNAAAVYQLVGTNEFHVLVISSDHIKAVSTTIEGKFLNERAKQFWALLQSDTYDPRAAGKELYDVVFKALEKELPPGTKTLLWSMDGNLRYVPMAALFDGKQYLVERFNNVTFTRADGDRLTRPVSAKWNASAFGSAKAHSVEHLGTRLAFAPLPGVENELATLFSRTKQTPVMDADILIDEAFTRNSMLASMKLKRPVVHIASHFSFRPGDDTRSFLLMGDGSAFTLADMKTNRDLFAGVDLLTLSACNTAAQQADANGREVDAFFELAQRLGANSVMATLWPVADNSTPWLMREFYDLKVNKNQNKAEALRNAQLALLNGSAKASRSTVRSDISAVQIIVEDEGKTQTPNATRDANALVIGKKDAKPFVADPSRPFAHPFYWSPFVLIGNWR